MCVRAAGKDPSSGDDDSMYAGKILLATVKGDVHDIGALSICRVICVA